MPVKEQLDLFGGPDNTPGRGWGRGRPETPPGSVRGRTPVLCPYCGKAAQLVTGEKIYPHRPDLFHKRFYECEDCDAWVGCHVSNRDKDSQTDAPRAMGRLANRELRNAKMAAHAYFDRLWKDGGTMSRTEAYHWLSDAMGLMPYETHIGMFDEEQCRKVVELCRAKIADISRDRMPRYKGPPLREEDAPWN